MGLFYLLPSKKDESDDHIYVSKEKVVLRTYGPPMVFWGYLLAVSIVLIFMGLAIKQPVMKMLHSEDQLNVALAILCLVTLIGIPVVSLFFFFYEKIIKRQGEVIEVIHRLFFIPVWRKRIAMKMDKENFIVRHFLDTPNLARMRADKELQGYSNRGYFQLWVKALNGKEVLLDRHSLKTDLEKIKDLLVFFS